MHYSDEQRKYHLSIIRRIIVSLEQSRIYPSVEKIYETLEKNRAVDQTLNWGSINYVHKLQTKVFRERKNRLNNELVHTTIAEIEDEFNENIAYLSAILKDKTLPPKVRIESARAIAGMRQILTQMKFDSGAFNRKLGTLEVDTLADRIIKDAIGYDRGKTTKDIEDSGLVLEGDARGQPLSLPTGD
jgi:hypothetical protein